MEYAIIAGLTAMGYAFKNKKRRQTVDHSLRLTDSRADLIQAEVPPTSGLQPRKPMPFYRSQKTVAHTPDFAQRRMELFTGLDATSEYRPKAESANHFVNGSSGVITNTGSAAAPLGYLDDSRAKQIISGPFATQNNVGPGEQIRVGPGLGEDPNVVSGSHGLHSTFRVLPSNVNAYRKNQIGQLPTQKGTAFTNPESGRPLDPNMFDHKEPLPRAWANDDYRQLLPQGTDVQAHKTLVFPEEKPTRRDLGDVSAVGRVPGHSVETSVTRGQHIFKNKYDKVTKQLGGSYLLPPADQLGRRRDPDDPRQRPTKRSTTNKHTTGVSAVIPGSQRHPGVMLRGTAREFSQRAGPAFAAGPNHLGYSMDPTKTPQTLGQPPVRPGKVPTGLTQEADPGQLKLKGSRDATNTPFNGGLNVWTATALDASRKHTDRTWGTDRRAPEAVGTQTGYTTALGATTTTYNKLPELNPRELL